MKIGKYYPVESEIKNALTYLAKYELDRTKHYINRDYLRGHRIVAHRDYDHRILQYWTFGDSETEKELYFLAVNSVEEVEEVIKYHALSTKHQQPSISTHGCTGLRFGGEPVITKICSGRYTLRYQWHLDV